MQQPQIVEKPALQVIGIEVAFRHALSPDSTAAKVIGPLWEAFFHRIADVPHRTSVDLYGVIYGRPEAERAHADELQYIAGVPVSSTETIPAGMVARTIPAGKFAVFVHRGRIAGIADTVREIYRGWLPPSGYKHAEIADIELYDRRFRYDSDDSEMEYWVSVVQRDATRS